MKKLLALLMALVMVLSMTTTVWAEEADSDATGAVAKIGNDTYATLAAAVEKVPTDGTQTIITLLGSVEGCGVKVVSGKNIVFDLNNHTYTVVNPTVGSEGTETNGFQLLSGSTVKFVNGKVVSNVAKILIQNYADLTLDGVTLTGSTSNQYVMSNNSGNVVFQGGTIITATEGNVAFDVCYWGKNESYSDGLTVTLNGATVNGNVEVSTYGELKEGAKFDLNLVSGTISGKLSLVAQGGNISDATITKAAGVTLAAPEGYAWDGNGKLIAVGDAVTLVGTKQFTTLPEAIAAANPGDTVKLLKDVDLSAQVVVDKKLTLDLNGQTIKNTTDIWSNADDAKSWSLISVQNGELTITGDGAVTAKANDCFAVDVYGGTLTIENGEFVGNITAAYAHTGILNVKGGTFSIQQEDDTKGKQFTLNCLDDEYGKKTAKIVVTGGTFAGFDPAHCQAETADNSTNFVADGYISVKDGDNYTVKKADAPITSGVVSTEDDGPVAVVDLTGVSVDAGSVADAVTEYVKISATRTTVPTDVTARAKEYGVTDMTAVDITIGKGLDGNDGAVTELNGVLEFVFTVDNTFTASNTYVFRMHNGAAEKFAPVTKAKAEAEPKDATFYLDGTALHVFASKYSTYAYGTGTTYTAPTDTVTGTTGGGSYAPSGHQFNTTLQGINKVTVGGKVVDSKYYTIVGTNVILSQEYINTLKAGSYKVVIENATHIATATLNVKRVESAKTFDAGIAVYAGMALSSAMGAAYVCAKKKH